MFVMVLPPLGRVTKIHTIQGNGAVSPQVGRIHTIEGVVVGDFQKSTQLDGFFVQEEDQDADEDPTTSEGIFVYAPEGDDVNIGDVVRMTGEVTEFYGSTQLYKIRKLKVIRKAAILPAATQISLPLKNFDFFERYESMLVSFSQILTVTDTYNLGRYGQITLSSGGRLMTPTQVTKPGAALNALQVANDLNRIILDDGSKTLYPNPIMHPSPGLNALNTLRIGDTVTELTGVLHYSFEHYRLHPTISPIFATKNPRPTVPPSVEGTLRVAGFNLFNYFTTINNGKNGARGANSQREFVRQRQKLISALVTIDAHILGIVELENNATTAIKNLVEGLNEATGTEEYAYIHTGKLGSDRIRVALLYQPGFVTPVGKYMTDPNKVFHRSPLAQTFEDTSGERLTVVINHFKSKRKEDASGADLDQKDGQAWYNHTRTLQAAQLLSFINTVVFPASGDPDVLILGDLNAYAREDPITHLENAGYTNLINHFVNAEAYSFVFFGQSGSLTYTLASSSLIPQVTGAAVWHINADEPRILDYNEEHKSPEQLGRLYAPDPYRSSDHDPLLLGFRLTSTRPH